MPSDLESYFRTDPTARAFDRFRRGQPLSLGTQLRLGLSALWQLLLHWFVIDLPGGLGIALRVGYYRRRLKALGRNCILERGVVINGAENISIADYVWIDRHVELTAPVGSIEVGRRVHIAPYAVIAGIGGVTIGDYAAIAAGARILSHSESPLFGKRMSGPMIPEELKGMITRPVVIGKDAVVSMNAVVLPGVVIGEGAVVAANSLVRRSVEPWTIVMGVPAKAVAKRSRVTVPDT
jgi:acetyltransferase-like isoleucine patch superfamily enzyme